MLHSFALLQESNPRLVDSPIPYQLSQSPLCARPCCAGFQLVLGSAECKPFFRTDWGLELKDGTDSALTFPGWRFVSQVKRALGNL